MTLSHFTHQAGPQARRDVGDPAGGEVPAVLRRTADENSRQNAPGGYLLHGRAAGGLSRGRRQNHRQHVSPLMTVFVPYPGNH